jgi:hypothetical protein
MKPKGLPAVCGGFAITLGGAATLWLLGAMLLHAVIAAFGLLGRLL